MVTTAIININKGSVRVFFSFAQGLPYCRLWSRKASSRRSREIPIYEAPSPSSGVRRSRTFRSRRSRLSRISRDLARSCLLEFSNTVARSLSLGFLSVTARSALLGFSIPMARSLTGILCRHLAGLVVAHLPRGDHPAVLPVLHRVGLPHGQAQLLPPYDP